MKFEEQFPEIDFRKHPEAAMIYDCKYLRLYLQKHCLSKQKVKEQINKLIVDHAHPLDKYAYLIITLAKLRKELGLNR